MTTPVSGAGIRPHAQDQADRIRRMNARPIDLGPTSQGLAGAGSSITASQQPSSTRNQTVNSGGFMVWLLKFCRMIPVEEMPGPEQRSSRVTGGEAGRPEVETPIPLITGNEEMPVPDQPLPGGEAVRVARPSIRPHFVEPDQPAEDHSDTQGIGGGERLDAASLGASTSKLRGSGLPSFNPRLGISGSEEFDQGVYGPYRMTQNGTSVYALPAETGAPERVLAKTPDSDEENSPYGVQLGNTDDLPSDGDSAAVLADSPPPPPAEASATAEQALQSGNASTLPASEAEACRPPQEDAAEPDSEQTVSKTLWV